MPLHPCVCPVCGANFMGIAPGEPCSSGCSAKQRRDGLLAGNIKVTQPDGATSSMGGGGSASSGGWCLVMALPLFATGAGALGALGYGLARLAGLA